MRLITLIPPSVTSLLLLTLTSIWLHAIEPPRSNLLTVSEGWQDGIAHLVSVTGEVLLNGETARNKQTFTSTGTTITTTGSGRTTLVFSNGLSLLILEDTTLNIERFKQEPFTSSQQDLVMEPSRSLLYMRLDKGRIFARHREHKTTSELHIHTPYGLLQSYSSGFMISVDEDQLNCISASKHLALYADDLLMKEFIQEGQILTYERINGKPHVTQRIVPQAEITPLVPHFSEVQYAGYRVYFETQGTGPDWSLKAQIALPKAHLLKAPASGYRSQGL